MPRARHSAAFAVAALQIGLLWAGTALADGIAAKPLPPLEGGISSLAHGIVGRGEVVGYSSDGVVTAVSVTVAGHKLGTARRSAHARGAFQRTGRLRDAPTLSR